jgi:predicted nucleic acid-binding protein
LNYLLDTNAVSEWVKPAPDSGIVAWLAASDEDHVFMSVVTLAERRYGTELLPQSARRRRLEAWLTDDLPQRFGARMLAVDAEIADRCGRLMARTKSSGREIGAMHALIAATADRHDLSVVTCNTKDFNDIGVKLVTGRPAYRRLCPL